jgi:hypothetical protein
MLRAGGRGFVAWWRPSPHAQAKKYDSRNTRSIWKPAAPGRHVQQSADAAAGSRVVAAQQDRRALTFDGNHVLQPAQRVIRRVQRVAFAPQWCQIQGLLLASLVR